MSDDVLDLDAARAARADGSKQPLEIRLAGQTFHAARPMPVSVAIAAAEGDVVAMVKGMFGDDMQAVLDAGVTIDDLTVIADRLAGGSGDLGESDASPG